MDFAINFALTKELILRWLLRQLFPCQGITPLTRWDELTWFFQECVDVITFGQSKEFEEILECG